MLIEILKIKKGSGIVQSNILDMCDSYKIKIVNGVIQSIFSELPYYFIRNCELFLQCIDAIVQSSCGYGYTLMLNNEPAPLSDLAKRTKEMIENINPNKSFLETLKQNVFDILSFGYTGTEVLLSQDMTEFELMNIPVHELRLCVKDKEYTKIKINGQERIWKFRKYAQVQDLNKKIYFKELYDPRPISKTSGKLTSNQTDLANPLVWVDNGNFTDYPYPQVLWQNVAYECMTLTAIHKLNFNYFNSGRIQTQVLLINGGNLSEDEKKAIVKALEDSKGLDNAHSLILIQAPNTLLSTHDGLEEKVSPVKIELKPLSPPQDSDPHSLQLIKNCQQSILSAFGTPPIVLGLTVDYNKATSDQAVETYYKKGITPLQQKLEDAYNKLLAFCGNPYRIKLNNPYRDKKVEEEEETKDKVEEESKDEKLKNNIEEEK